MALMEAALEPAARDPWCDHTCPLRRYVAITRSAMSHMTQDTGYCRIQTEPTQKIVTAERGGICWKHQERVEAEVSLFFEVMDLFNRLHGG